MSSPVSRGTKLGHYEVLSQLGAGGMGEVYLAHDTNLDRKVAIKILPAEFAARPDRMRRFVQEAKAAAALNHPNIAHVYDISESEGVHFIAMEFIDGTTLRDKIHSEHASLVKLLLYLQQAAEGLAKAHASGIVHRDLKPDNIMITRDGHAKVLDFGLAKLAEPVSEPGAAATASFDQEEDLLENRRGDADARQMDDERQTLDLIKQPRVSPSPISLSHTSPGAIMGTVGYMSPEQAQGKTSELDSRSDTFSFGCILFEAATGRRPFQSDSVIKSLYKLVHEPPPSVAEFNPAAPADLQRIIRRCLEKDPEDRYQTIKDVAIELRQLRNALADPHNTQQPQSSDSAGQPVRSTSSSNLEKPTSRIWSNKLVLLVVLIFPLIAGLALLYAVNVRKSQPRMKSFQNLTITRVTNEGNVETAAISPDGNYIAYTLEESGKRSLWTKHLGTGSRVQIVAPHEAYAMNASTFSPDGYVYYTLSDEANPQGTLFQIPVLGGNPKKLISRVSEPISLSHDGKQIAFARHHVDGTKDDLFLANADGSNERLLLSVKEPNWLGNSSPSWSPDNTTLAVAYGSEDRNEETGRNLGMTPILISVADGKFKPLARSRWMYLARVSWFNDGSGLLFVAQQLTLSPPQLWQISYPRGDAQRVTNDLNSYSLSSLTQTQNDSSVLLVQSDPVSNIWVATVGQPGSEKALTSRKNTLEGSRGLAWTTDGRIVFDANVNGKAGLWTVTVEDGNPKPLINNDTEEVAPETSLYGRHMIFGSHANGGIQVWSAYLDGTNLQRLTSDKGGVPGFALSPDGRWVVYTPFTGGIRKVSIDGGDPPTELVPSGSMSYPQVSPDGKFVAYFYRDDQSLRPRIGIINFDNGSLVKTLDLPLTAQPTTSSNLFYRGWHWSPAGTSIVYVNTLGSVSNLWSQPIGGGPPKQITDFKSDRILTFAFSPDGRQLACARSSYVSDAVLIESEK